MNKESKEMLYVFLFTSGIFIITIITILIFINGCSKHNSELEKIKYLEKKYKKIEDLKSKTVECDIPGLLNPRSCYFDSNNRCSWNDTTNRCEM